jgi:hypothetical protein
MADSKKTPDPAAQMQGTIDKQSKVIDSLTARLDAIEKPADSVDRKPKPRVGTKVPKESFEQGDKKYRFKVGKYYDGNSNIMLAADALKNPRELERLVFIKSGIIEEVK